MLEWLENWYEIQCNGDWEHIYGIKIETIDNPGWEITIDAEGTDLFLKPHNWILIGGFEDRWVGFKIFDNKFNGACDPKNLNLLISIFKKFTENVEIDSEEILASLKR